MKNIFRFSITLCLLILFPLIITACGKQNMPEKPDIESTPLKITFAGGQPGGTYYMLASGIAESVNKTYPGSVVTIIPGSGVANIIKINNRQVDLSTSQNAVVADALDGRSPFEAKLDNIASIGSFYDCYYQIVVDKKLGITSFDEIINNKMKIRISADSLNSIAEVSFKRLLNEYGVTYEDFKAWGGDIVFQDKAASSDMLSDGLIDGFCTIDSYPTPSIQEAALSKDLVFLTIKPEIIENLGHKYGYGKGIVPADTYKNINNDVMTFTTFVVVVIPKDAPDDTAYKVARSIHLNLDYIKNIHATLKDLTPDKLTTNPGAPLHQGAQKYYKEAGIIK